MKEGGIRNRVWEFFASLNSLRAYSMGQPGWTGRPPGALFRLQCCGASRPFFLCGSAPRDARQSDVVFLLVIGQHGRPILQTGELRRSRLASHSQLRACAQVTS